MKFSFLFSDLPMVRLLIYGLTGMNQSLVFTLNLLCALFILNGHEMSHIGQMAFVNEQLIVKTDKPNMGNLAGGLVALDPQE